MGMCLTVAEPSLANRAGLAIVIWSLVIEWKPAGPLVEIVSGIAKNWLATPIGLIAVDAVRGTRAEAFDHAAVAKALGADIRTDQLPIENLQFTRQAGAWVLAGREETLAVGQ